MPQGTAIKEFVIPEKYQSSIDSSRYSKFLRNYCQQPGIDYAVVTFPWHYDDLLGHLNLVSTNKEFQFYWEKPSESFAMAAGGHILKITKNGSTRFEDIYTAIETVKQRTAQYNAGASTNSGIHFLGGFSFFDEVHDTQWKDFGAASFILPKRLMIKKGDEVSVSIALSLPKNRSPEKIHQKLLNELYALDEDTSYKQKKADIYSNGSAQKSPFSTNGQYKKWVQSVAGAKQQIADKKLDKVVLSRQLKISKSESNTPVDMLQKLRDQYPKCCSFLFKMKDAPAFVGCSPEQLLSFHQNALRTEALAGSIARGKDEEEDDRFKNALLGSSKNNAEHQFVVQSIEQDLAPFVKNMQRSEQPIIKKLANVQHLYTPVQAQMIGDKNPLTILGQLHPTPAVGGYPRKIAVDYIKNNESLNRGWFASPVGWINSEGAGDFTVAIRSGLIDKTNALLFAGCGIVADSNPETEWQETNLKFMPMLSALNHD